MTPRNTGTGKGERSAPHEGDTVVVTATRLSPPGDGIALHMERELHIPDLFPGEQATVRILDLARRSKLGRAKVLDRPGQARHQDETPDPIDTERRAAPCPQHCSHTRGRCTGCPMMTVTPGRQRALKQQMLLETFGLSVDSFVHLGGDLGGDLGYRASAKRVVGGRPGALILGSYRRDSHRVADMAGCLVDHPSFAAVTAELVEAANALNIEPCREVGDRLLGDLRHIWMKTDGERVLLTLVCRSTTGQAARELAPRLRIPAGVSCCAQDQVVNKIRGEDLVHVHGERALQITLAGQRREIGPLAFLQPNPSVAQHAYQDLICDPNGQPMTGEHAWDLYSGAGVTAALLGERFASVEMCESYPESAAALGVEAQDTLAFLEAALSSDSPRDRTPSLVLANPPRRGLGAPVCAALARVAAPHLHLMSCNPASLARDLQRLDEHYRLVCLRAYDTLPQTAHLELVAWLSLR